MREREREKTLKNNISFSMRLCTSYVFSEHFYTSPYSLTEVLTVLQSSFMGAYTNSQIYSFRNICSMASWFLHRFSLCCAPVYVPIYAPVRPNQSVPTDPVLNLLSRSADVELVSQHFPSSSTWGSLESSGSPLRFLLASRLTRAPRPVRLRAL